jgi:hypothetical protein
MAGRSMWGEAAQLAPAPNHTRSFSRKDRNGSDRRNRTTPEAKTHNLPIPRNPKADKVLEQDTDPELGPDTVRDKARGTEWEMGRQESAKR